MGQLNIPDAAIVYVDTSIVIYTVENHASYWQLLQPLWSKLRNREVQIFSSDLNGNISGLYLMSKLEPLFQRNLDLPSRSGS